MQGLELLFKFWNTSVKSIKDSTALKAVFPPDRTHTSHRSSVSHWPSKTGPLTLLSTEGLRGLQRLPWPEAEATWAQGQPPARYAFLTTAPKTITRWSIPFLFTYKSTFLKKGIFGEKKRLHVEDCCCLVTKSCPTLLWPHGLWPAMLLCPWDFPDKNTGVGCHFCLQGVFLSQGLTPQSNPHLLHCRRILYHWATREALRLRRLF